MTRVIRLLWRLPLLVLLLALMLAALLLVNPLGERVRIGRWNLSQQTVRLWSKLYVLAFSLRVRMIRHAGAIWPGSHALLVANHQSWQDIFVLLSRIPIRFVAKREIRRWPLIGTVVAAAGTVFIRRGDMQSTDQVRERMREALDSATNVLVFPEGRVPPEAAVGRFHARLFAPAVAAGLPVQPICLRYLNRDGQSQQNRFRPGESFLSSLLRLTTAGSETAEIHVLPAIHIEPGMTRREVATAAETMVRNCYHAPVSDTRPV